MEREVYMAHSSLQELRESARIEEGFTVGTCFADAVQV